MNEDVSLSGRDAPSDELPTRQLCENCGGEGMLYTSRYGGNDPDVWSTGECPVCDGTGYELVETEEIDEEDIWICPPTGGLPND